MYNILIVLRNQNRSIGVIKLCFIFAALLVYGGSGNLPTAGRHAKPRNSSLLAYGVTGNTSDFGSEESRFDP
jgi:hypothetical protein